MKKNYWTVRAEHYNKLYWVTDKYLLQQLINFCKLKKSDIIHEIGCGTGVVSQAIIPIVRQVVASDNAVEMLYQLHRHEKIITMCLDLEQDPVFLEDFDKIIARMVFHHINDLEKGLNNCYKMLKPDGSLIIQEGIPPTENKTIIEWYKYVMGKKEKRHTFTETQMYWLLTGCGFRNITSKVITDKNFSVSNWLASSGQDKKVCKEIYELHKTAPEYIKKVYNMRITKDDILINTKVLLIKGTK